MDFVLSGGIKLLNVPVFLANILEAMQMIELTLLAKHRDSKNDW